MYRNGERLRKSLIIAPFTLNNRVNIYLTFGCSRGKAYFSGTNHI